MRLIDLAVKDLTQLVRDWKAALFLVIMPVVFTVLIGFAFGGGGGEKDARLPVAFVDQDGGRLGASLLTLLDASAAIRPFEARGRDAATTHLEKTVRDGDAVAAVVVPPGYTEQWLAGGSPRLVVIADTAQQAGVTAQGEIQAAAARLAGAVETGRLSVQAFEARATFADAAARDNYLLDGIGLALDAWQTPPLTIATVDSGTLRQQQEANRVAQSGFSHTSPSMMVQFAIAGLIGAATVLVLERKSRALRRLLTTSISRVEIIAGHYLAMFIMIVAQLTILIAFGQLALGVPYMREPLATLLMALATALWVASLGLLIGVLARTDEQAIIFSLVPMFVLGGLGGAWMPLEYTGKTFQAIGHLLPSAWAMDGFENIVVRGLGLQSVLLPVGIMLAYAIGLFILAVWRFRFE